MPRGRPVEPEEKTTRSPGRTRPALTPASIAGAAYIVAALLFIMSLAGLSKHETSRAGVGYGIAGMLRKFLGETPLLLTSCSPRC